MIASPYALASITSTSFEFSSFCLSSSPRITACGGTVAVIVSAIYFKAQWLIEFMPSGEIDFWIENGVVRVPAMSVKGGHITAALDDDYTAVEIPYKGTSIVMDIIMPRNFSEAIPRYRELILKALKSLDSKKDPTFARLVMPKFNITYSTNLNNYMMELGIRKAFMLGEADFSRMTPAKAAVDRVLHKAVIKVNEKGTEAAAVTAIIIATSAPAYQLEIVLNHPFIFILRDKASGAILFIGHVVNPLQQGEA
jgi:serpin B